MFIQPLTSCSGSTINQLLHQLIKTIICASIYTKDNLSHDRHKELCCRHYHSFLLTCWQQRWVFDKPRPLLTSSDPFTAKGRGKQSGVDSQTGEKYLRSLWRWHFSHQCLNYCYVFCFSGRETGQQTVAWRKGARVGKREWRIQTAREYNRQTLHNDSTSF